MTLNKGSTTENIIITGIMGNKYKVSGSLKIEAIKIKAKNIINKVKEEEPVTIFPEVIKVPTSKDELNIESNPNILTSIKFTQNPINK